MANRDWSKYQEWLRDGGIPDPADPPPVVIDYQGELELKIAAAVSLPALGAALLGTDAAHKAKIGATAK